MSKKWPGGIITPTPATPTGPYQDGAASGIWTIQQADYWIKQGLWPIAGNVLQRGVFGGGTSPDASSMNYVTIASTGTTTTFGTLTYGRNSLAAVSSGTRGVFGSGQTTDSNAMDYITIATTGNATSFGAVPQASSFPQSAGASNGTRGLFAGGQNSGTTSVTYYITIATTGNASTFGVLTSTRNACGATASTTRMCVAGGFAQSYPAGALGTTIDYFTIATTGNATSFGSLVSSSVYLSVGNVSSGTRGVFARGASGSNGTSVSGLEYITIATTGNATFFGNLNGNASNCAATGSTTVGLFYWGTSVDAITIATTGNATSFGTSSVGRSYGAGLSNCHGGL